MAIEEEEGVEEEGVLEEGECKLLQDLLKEIGGKMMVNLILITTMIVLLIHG